MSLINFKVPDSICPFKASGSLKSGLSVKTYSIIESAVRLFFVFDYRVIE